MMADRLDPLSGLRGQREPQNRATSPTPSRRMLGDRNFHVPDVRSSGAQSTIDNPFLTLDDTIAQPVTQRTELEEYVHRFVEDNNLQHRHEILLFGARLARDKHGALRRYKEEITDPEKILIQEERDKTTGFWKQAKFFKATIITASLGGMIQGWTQSVNNGTAYGMPDQFNLCFRSQDNCSASELWTFGMLNAVPYLSAGLFGTILADPLQENVLGRRGSVMLSCLITLASTIGASVTHNATQLAICRAINGLALGAKASIIPIYSGELSPEHIRGAILANWQLSDAAGIFLGFLCNLLVVTYVANSFVGWRILTNTTLIPTIPLLIMIYLMPESPRYLMKHGKYEKALDAFNQIQTTPLLAARDLMYAHAQLDFESRMLKKRGNEFGTLQDRIAPSALGLAGRSGASLSISPASSPGLAPQTNMGVPRVTSAVGIHSARHDDMPIQRRPSDVSSLDIDMGIQTAKGKADKAVNPYAYHIGVTGYYRRLMELWTNKRCRRALLAASVAMVSQQMTGVNTIAFLGTIVWENSLVRDQSIRDPQKDAKTSAIIGLAFGAANYLAGLPAYWLADKIGRSIMLAIGLPNMAWSMLLFAFLFKIKESSVQVPMVSIFAIIFVLIYAPTAGTSPFSISAEVFPLVSREAGMAVSVAVNLLGAGVFVLVFPFVMHSIGTTSSLAIFAVTNVVAFFLVFLFVPETKLRTLEELQYTFDLPTRWHVHYRATYIQRHFRKNWWRYLIRKEIPEEDVPIEFFSWARIVHGEDQDSA